MIKKYCDMCGKEIKGDEVDYGFERLRLTAEATISKKNISSEVDIKFNDHPAMDEDASLCKSCLLKIFTDAAKETGQ